MWRLAEELADRFFTRAYDFLPNAAATPYICMSALPRRHDRFADFPINPWTVQCSPNQPINPALYRASEQALAGALVYSLISEETRAHQLLMGAYAVNQGEAQQFLQSFGFSGNRAEHSRLSFARHVSHRGEIPEWAWQYAKRGRRPNPSLNFWPRGLRQKRNDPIAITWLTRENVCHSCSCAAASQRYGNLRSHMYIAGSGCPYICMASRRWREDRVWVL